MVSPPARSARSGCADARAGQSDPERDRSDAQGRVGSRRHIDFCAQLDEEPLTYTRPGMHQTKKGMDAESGQVHTVIGTAASAQDINTAEALLHGEEVDVYTDAGYQGIQKRCADGSVRWHALMAPGKRRKLDLSDRLDAIYDQMERPEGWRARQGGASILDHKAPVWPYENPIPWPDKQHRPGRDAVCTG